MVASMNSRVLCWVIVEMKSSDEVGANKVEMFFVVRGDCDGRKDLSLSDE